MLEIHMVYSVQMPVKFLIFLHIPMSPPRPTELAQCILRQLIAEGDLTIDATAGNGHDTLFLAECVGHSGQVLAFDIQQSALDAARVHVNQAGWTERVNFYQTSHANLSEHAQAETASVVVFNLGYLPGGDHDLTTEASETLRALDAAATALKPGGTLSIICYPGHPQGATEAAAVETWSRNRAEHGWRMAEYRLHGTLKPAPFLILLGKKAGH